VPEAPARARRGLVAVALLALAVSCRGAGAAGRVPETPFSGRRATPAPGAPSFLFILSDDQSVRLFTRELMPQVFSRIVDRGILFRRAYVNDSLCCPSRASILTGLEAHHTGVDTNRTPLQRREVARPTFVRALYAAGFRTMFAGKYLNSEDCHPRLGWDRWVCGGATQVNPTLDVDGKVEHLDGYTVDILADQVIDFLRTTPRTAPFFAYFSPKSPHLPADDPRI
jgi:N-acetylglucosamine-6-sulfatase